MEPFRLEITPTLAQHMSYQKFGPRPVRMLVMESNYWLDQACARAAATMGWEVRRVPVKMIGTMSRDMLKDLFQAILTHQPDFVLSINLSGMDVDGMFARFLDDVGVPHVTWFVDGPRTIMDGNTSSTTPTSVALTWECAYVSFLQECGFGHVHVMPLGVDESIFSHPPVDEHPHPPTFVGNSMIHEADKEMRLVMQVPALRAAVDDAFDSGRVTRANFAEGGSSILGAAAAGFDKAALYHAERVFFIEGTRRLRSELIVTLGPHGLHVRGDSMWEALTTQIGPSLGYEGELGPYYRNCPVNLNVTSVQMATTVNQRVFDCPAAGGFLLTDNQAALHDLFDVEKEVVTYDGFEDGRDKMNWFMAHPKSRREITERARARVLGEHTYQHRLQAIVALLKENFA